MERLMANQGAAANGPWRLRAEFMTSLNNNIASDAHGQAVAELGRLIWLKIVKRTVFLLSEMFHASGLLSFCG
jgi:hypothetical protein